MGSDAEAIVNATYAAAEPSLLDPAQRYAYVVPPGGSVKVVEPAEDSQLPVLTRVRGHSLVYEVDSFKWLWEKYSSGSSELFAHPKRHRVTAVFNADVSATEAGFRDHRAELVCELTPGWKAWAEMDGKLVDQETFANFLEDRLIDVVSPTGAAMLELAQSFEATTSVDFQSSQILASGQRQLQFKETVQARAGQTGQLEIPSVIELGLQPFEGGDRYRVNARFRYRISSGSLRIGVRLERPEDVLQEAFVGIADAVSSACAAPVLVGASPEER